MAAPTHIPSSLWLLSLTLAGLAVAVTELGLLAYMQKLINVHEMGFFSTYTILNAGIDVGITTCCLSIIFAVYFLVATRVARSAYHKIAALTLVMTSIVFWSITLGLWADVFSLHGTVVAIPDWYSHTSDGHTDWVALGTTPGMDFWNAAFALVIIEWVLFFTSTVLLFRATFSRRATTSQANIPVKTVDDDDEEEEDYVQTANGQDQMQTANGNDYEKTPAGKKYLTDYAKTGDAKV